MAIAMSTYSTDFQWRDSNPEPAAGGDSVYGGAVLLQADGLHACEPPFSQYLAWRNAEFVLTVNNGRRKVFRLIIDRLTYGRRTP
jgi:hypothetical protein